MSNQQFATPQDALAHHGVKGMRWGVRKTRLSSGEDKTSKESLVTISSTGSITIKKGGELQRVVRRSDGVLFKTGTDLGDSVTYASFSKKDNLTYENLLGRKKSIFTKTPSEVLTFTAKADLKSPSIPETTKLYFDTLKNNPAARAEIESGLKTKGSTLFFSKADVENGIKNPTSARAFSFYAFAIDKSNFQGMPSVANAAFYDSVRKAGYNMLLDSSDASTGYADTPVILLDAKKTVEISGSRIVDKVSLKSVSKALADIEKVSDGKLFLEKLGYI